MHRIPEPVCGLLRPLCLCLLLALGACGPGTGGTGTGPVTLRYGGGASGAVFAPAPSVCAVAACERVDLRLDASGVELETGCARFVHTGAWTVDDAGLLVLAGALETTSREGVTSAPATLRLQFSGAELPDANVTVLLLDAGGRAVLGSFTLGPDAAASPAHPPCVPG